MLCTISNQQVKKKKGGGILNWWKNYLHLKRQELAREFKQLFGEDLSAKLKKALSGDFEELM